MGELLKRIRVAAIRRQADINSRYCFAASLAEAAVNTGTRRKVSLAELERQMGILKKGRTPPKQLFRHLRAGADALGLEVVGVVANPSFLDLCDDPLAYSITARGVVGEIPVSKPHIRILVNEHESGQYSSHAELDDGSTRTDTRLRDLESKGWSTAAVIVLKRRE